MDNILLRSQDRTNPGTTTPDNCQIRLNDTIKGKYKLKYLSFTNLIYNITSANNQFSYSQASTTKVATLLPGLYDGTSILSVLQTALNASTPAPSGTFACSLGSTNGYITITNNTTAFIVLSSTSTNASRILGFGYVDSSSALTNTSISPVYLPKSVCFNLGNKLGLMNSALQTRLGIYIPLNQAFGSVISFQPNQYFQEIVDFGTDGINSVLVVITDSTSNLLSLNGADFEILLEKYVQ